MKPRYRISDDIFAVLIDTRWLWWAANDITRGAWDVTQFCYIDDVPIAEEDYYRDSCLLEFALLGAPVEALLERSVSG